MTRTLFGELFGDQRGCCPGQTGHHLIPDAWAINGCDKSKYKTNAAPVVCVEGVSHSIGSHGTIHDAMDKIVKRFYRDNGEGEKVDLDGAIDMACNSHKSLKGFCNEKCIKAQLKSYYKDCGCGQLTPSTKNEKNKGKDSSGTDEDMM